MNRAEPWSLVGADRMRALDRHTIDDLGVPGDVLMESAGRSVVDVLLARRRADDEVVVVCGLGNNGGDGFVVARHLHQLGVRVRIILLGAADRIGGDAAPQVQRARALGVRIDGPEAPLPQTGLIVDAVFGTGLSRIVDGLQAEWITRINDASDAGGVDVVAVDVPSGLDADTGQVLGAAVRAHCTVTIGLPKVGLVLEPGRSLAGEIVVARIGIADRLAGEVEAEGYGAIQMWTPAVARDQLPDRLAQGHKGSFGHVLVAAGSEGKTGAAALCARAAIRAGAGLVTVGCPAGLNDILEVKCTEAMTVPVPETERRGLAEAALPALVELAGQRDVLALGPGLGEAPETRALTRGLAEKVGVPLVLDADGLNAFAADASALTARPGSTVLTPHPGEAARLLGSSASEVNADRIGAARELAATSGCVVVLKGAATVCADPGGRAIVNPTGGPNLATGGTGDVLTGVIASLIAQGLGPLAAAAAGVYWHGRAADRLSVRDGDAGLLAGDLADALPAARQALLRAPQTDPTETRGQDGERVAEPYGRGTLVSFPGA